MRVTECVTTNEVLPNLGLASEWEEIVSDPLVKDRLLHTVLLGLQLRPRLPFAVTAMHGLTLLHGPPGTGKTTLARSVAHEVSGLVAGGRTRLIEVNPHGLMSAEHGQSQQKVHELLCEQVPLLADDGMPTVVVLDEVESMAVARSAASLSANPADVHRATDAVLSALDRNAREHPHLITVATSNFTEALDEAFRSRADAEIEVPLPNEQAVLLILIKTLTGFGGVYPALVELAADDGLARVASGLLGRDGRQVRKYVTEVLARQRKTVLDPGSLSLQQLLDGLPAAGQEPAAGAGRRRGGSRAAA